MKATRNALLLAFSLLLGSSQAAGVSFENQVQPFLTQNCYACHMTGSASGGLALEPGAAYENLVDVPSEQSPLLLVASGEAELSYLLHKLRGTQLEVEGSGMQMPLGGAVSADILDLISRWITEGAQNN